MPTLTEQATQLESKLSEGILSSKHIQKKWRIEQITAAFTQAGREQDALVWRYRAELKELRKNPIGCCFAGVGQPCPNHEK